MNQAFFVVGTDTGVGKTHATCALLHATRQRGYTSLAMKPIAAGVADDGRNSDVTQLLAASSATPALELVNPYLFMPPIAPHIAAREAGRSIEIAVIVNACQSLRQQAQVLWVEGVGGFRVPLDEQLDSADLAVALNLPLVLVVGMRLGCLNHALLTMEAMQARQLRLVGWIANRIDAAMTRFEANLETLSARLAAPLLGVIPYGASPLRAAALLSLDAIPELAGSTHEPANSSQPPAQHFPNPDRAQP